MLTETLKKALDVVHQGGVILYPTDTIWGLGCDANNAEAVEKINKIKQRSTDKSFIILLDSDHKLPSYVREIPDVAYQLIEYTDKPLTIIFDGGRNVAPNVLNTDGSLGIRIVKHDFCTPFLQKFRKPLVSTSANISGQPSPQIFDEIAQEIKDAVDYIVEFEQENTTKKQPSTIMKLDASGKFEFIRK